MGDIRGYEKNFEEEWEFIQNKYQRKEQILHALEEREIQLKPVVEELKHELVRANGGMISRVVKVNKLTRRVDCITTKKARANGTKLTLEQMDSIYRLPDEIWRKILLHITDDTDKSNITDASPFFLKIQLRTSLLFKEIFPHIVRYLGRKNKLKCRLVCSDWNYGVEEYFENSPSNKPHDENCNDGRHPPFISRMESLGFYPKYWVGNLYEPYAQWWWFMRAEFRHRTGYFEANPIVGREIIIHSERGIGELAMDDFEDFLWFVTLYGKTDFEAATLLVVTDDIFRKRPRHLRKLRLCGYSKYVDNKPATLEAPLFTYRHLETLQLDEALRTQTGESHPITDALLEKYHDQLGRLHVRIESLKTARKFDWPNLKELHVMEIWSIEQCEILSQLNMPKLKKLAVGVNFISYDEILDALHKQPSIFSRLDSLRICGITLWKESFGKVEGLYAPASLKTLEIEHSRILHTMTWYNILLHFPFVENLNVFWRRNDKRYAGEITVSNIVLRPKYEYVDQLDAGVWDNFEGEKDKIELSQRVESDLMQVHKFVYEKNMYKSIIWELLPKLKVFTFQLDLYTRTGYERFKNRQNRRTPRK